MAADRELAAGASEGAFAQHIDSTHRAPHLEGRAPVQPRDPRVLHFQAEAARVVLEGDQLAVGTHLGVRRRRTVKTGFAYCHETVLALRLLVAL